MATACTSCTLSSIGWIPIITWHAVLTLLSCGKIFTLFAHIIIDASAMSITLASWTLDKGPLIVLLFRTKTGIKKHLIIKHSNKLHWSPGRPFNAVSSSSITRIVAPATPRLFQTLATGPQSRTILGRAGGSLPLQTLPIWKGDYVGVGVNTPLGAATPHTLHAVARTVGTRRP